MISFGPKKAQPTGHAERIKAWAAAALAGANGGSPFEADVTLMVAELECHEPGCPPVETVVSILDKANPQKLKIVKTMADVVQADVATAVAALLQAGGGEPAADEPEGCCSSSGGKEQGPCAMDETPPADGASDAESAARAAQIERMMNMQHGGAAAPQAEQAQTEETPGGEAQVAEEELSEMERLLVRRVEPVRRSRARSGRGARRCT